MNNESIGRYVILLHFLDSDKQVVPIKSDHLPFKILCSIVYLLENAMTYRKPFQLFSVFSVQI